LGLLNQHNLHLGLKALENHQLNLFPSEALENHQPNLYLEQNLRLFNLLPLEDQ
jgi:hypothetical protein